ncbi:MAG: S8 family serine peptidase [Microscillaceae bacterium]|jgi:hypothetical protein|nr:S8 family serine peptidase [Microscillaceae bacterium]
MSNPYIYLLIILGSLGNFRFASAQNQFGTKKTAPTILLTPQKSQNLRLKLNQSLEFEQWLIKYLPQLKITQKSAIHSIVLLENVNFEALQKLQNCPFVDFIDVANRQAYEERENDLRGFQVNRVSALKYAYPQLTGAGMGVSIKENPFDKNDIDFKGRIVNFANFPDNNTTHATTMASLIAGGGNSSPLAQGVAWQAQLFTASFANLLPDNGANLLNQGVSVQNHSYGVNAIENYYGIETEAYDRECRLNPTLLHIFASGNSGTLTSQTGLYAGVAGFANLTAQFKMSKNTLSIGEISQNDIIKPLSSRGPAYDGRVKPELVAYGGAGSSESSALASGIAILVQQAYKLKFNALPPAALVKSALINSAKDLGRPEIDFEYGYGKINALGAVQILDNEQFIQASIAKNQIKTYTIQVPSHTRKLKITLVWHDSEAQVNASQALVNDLDLSLFEPISQQTWLPWVLNSYPHVDSLKKNAVRKIDRLNNIEQITVDLPPAGAYQVSIKAFDLKSDNQAFSLTYQFDNQAFRWLYPQASDYVEYNEILNTTLKLEWEAPPIAGTLQYRYSNQNTWQSLAQFNDLSVGQLAWQIPDTLALVQFRLLSANDEVISQSIPITQKYNPKVGFNCAQDLMLWWNKVPQAEQYQVYRLGEKYLESFVSTVDTFLIINKLQENSQHFAVASRLNDRWIFWNTVNYTQQGTDCYLRNLLVREIIQDTITLDLVLGTTYRLSKVALQSKQNGIFQTIQQITNPSNRFIVLQDSRPQPGINYYRVELTDNQGLKIYSSEAFAYYLPKDEFLLAPNPVRLGEDMTLLDEEEQIENVEIINSFGKIVGSEVLGFGSFKYLTTSQLSSGVHFLRFVTKSGKVIVKRFVVL